MGMHIGPLAGARGPQKAEAYVRDHISSAGLSNVVEIIRCSAAHLASLTNVFIVYCLSSPSYAWSIRAGCSQRREMNHLSSKE